MWTILCLEMGKRLRVLMQTILCLETQLFVDWDQNTIRSRTNNNQAHPYSTTCITIKCEMHCLCWKVQCSSIMQYTQCIAWCTAVQCSSIEWYSAIQWNTMYWMIYSAVQCIAGYCAVQCIEWYSAVQFVEWYSAVQCIEWYTVQYNVLQDIVQYNVLNDTAQYDVLNDRVQYNVLNDTAQ